MKRVWHPYWNWEEYHAGMWRKVSAQEERDLISLAIEFTSNADLYGSFMVKVVNSWPISCEHNLTDHSLNKQAWIGHAACSLAHSLPEYIVRMASTIRHNRARGVHSIELMSGIVSELVESGMSDAWILRHIGMDKDELLRLKQITGLAALFANKEFSEAAA